MELEEKAGGSLTNRQKEFSKLIVEGIYSNAECARRAGYSQKVAVKYAHKLLNGKDFPLVPQHIAELRQEHERKYGSDTDRTTQKTIRSVTQCRIGRSIFCRNQRRKNSSRLGGLTVDRRENQHVHSYDQMSRDQIIEQLSKLREEHPAAFIEAEYEEIVDADTGAQPLEQIEDCTARGNTQD